MKIYKTKLFAKWANNEKLDDRALISAINEMEQGSIDANLGGSVYKKRIPVRGKGKRSSLRTIIAYRTRNKAIFIYGFAKNVRADITPKETVALKKLAKLYLGLDAGQITKAVKEKELMEIVCHEK